MLRPSLSILLLFLCAVAQGSTFIPRVLYGPNSYQPLITSVSTLPEQNVSFPVDWNNVTGEHFFNRYWTNATFYELGGPVFIYDAGAGDAADAMVVLTEEGSQSAVMQLARAFHGAAVVMEHRYYGKSIPFVQQVVNGTLDANINNLTSSQWQFHTLDQAVADIENFPRLFSVSVNASSFGNVAGGAGLLPNSTPYIVLGGGLGGVRAAVSRLVPSSNIFASWASSAPVQAQIDFPQYFETVEKAIPRANCSSDVIQVQQLVDQILSGNLTGEDKTEVTVTSNVLRGTIHTAIFNQTFNVSAVSLEESQDAESTSLLDLMREFGLSFSFFQNDGVPALKMFCDDLETQQDQSPPDSKGLVHFEGVEGAMFDYLTSLNRFTQGEITLLAPTQNVHGGHQKRQSDSGDDSDDDGSDEDGSDGDNSDDDESEDSDQSVNQDIDDSLSWQYQYCTQFGFFIANDPANNSSLQSKSITPAAIQAECTQSFKNIGVTIPTQPSISQVLKYGGWNMTPAKTFFTNGLLDPWRAVSVGSDAAGSPKRLSNRTIPSVNETGSASHYFGMNTTGAVHAQDMVIFDGSSDIAKNAFNQSLHVFASALQLWLNDFHPVVEAAKAASTASTSAAIGTPSVSAWTVMGCAGVVSILLAL